MANPIDKIWNKGEEWVDGFIQMLPNLLMAIAVLVGFYFLASLVKKLILKLLGKVSNNKAVVRLLANLATIIVMIIGLFIALDLLHLDKTVTSILAGAGVLGLAIALAFQDPILNMISGVLLSVRSMPFKIDDLVRTNGHFGRIEKITLRSTILKSLDGLDIVIPNKTVLQNPIENYSLSPGRRVEIACGVGYGSDLEHVQKTAIKAMEALDRDESKDIELMFTEFGGSSIDFTLRYWIKESEQKTFLISRSQGIIKLKQAFDKEGINIPFPIRTLEFSQKDVVAGLSKS